MNDRPQKDTHYEEALRLRDLARDSDSLGVDWRKYHNTSAQIHATLAVADELHRIGDLLDMVVFHGAIQHRAADN